MGEVEVERDADGDKKSGVETLASSIIRRGPSERAGPLMERWGVAAVEGWGGDCKAEMGGLLISTMQYHAAGGSKARFGGNENGLSRRLMAHKDRAFRWDGRLNLDGGD